MAHRQRPVCRRILAVVSCHSLGCCMIGSLECVKIDSVRYWLLLVTAVLVLPEIDIHGPQRRLRSMTPIAAF